MYSNKNIKFLFNLYKDTIELSFNYYIYLKNIKKETTDFKI